ASLAAKAGVSPDRVSVSVYDPVHTDADRALMQRLGVGVSGVTDCTLKGGEPLPTLVYMPHCPLALYASMVKSARGVSDALPSVSSVSDTLPVPSATPGLWLLGNDLGPACDRVLMRHRGAGSDSVGGEAGGWTLVGKRGGGRKGKGKGRHPSKARFSAKTEAEGGRERERSRLMKESALYLSEVPASVCYAYKEGQRPRGEGQGERASAVRDVLDTALSNTALSHIG
ncbi:hypothetical protein KIPB_004162, partial [Kipferlia bialata]